MTLFRGRRERQEQPQEAAELNPELPRPALIISNWLGGSIANFVTGGALSGTTGTAANAPRDFGLARTYSAGYDSFDTPASLDAPAAYTWLVRARFSSFGSFGGVFTKTAGSSTDNGFGTFTISGNNLEVAHNNSSSVIVDSVASITGAGLTVLVCSWDGATVRFWRGGQLITSTALATAVTSGNGQLKVCSNRNTTETSADHDATIVWPFRLPDALCARLSRAVGPEFYSLVLAPRPTWVPVSSGGAASPVAANATYYQMIAQQRIGY